MIQLASPDISVEDRVAVDRVLQSGWLSNGPEVAAFEEAVAERLGVAHAVAVSSGTDALVLALHALEVGPGDEVIVPAFTYLATLHAVALTGATPRVVDVDPLTFNIDPGLLAAAINERTKALLPVDQFGLSADVAAIRAISDLPIIEDAACALGATRSGEPCGKGVALACFSFHPRKVITTGEGGMVVTDDGALAETLRARRSHGRDGAGRFTAAGGNHRMSDINAALGRSQLGRLDDMVERRRALAARYLERFQGNKRLTTQEAPKGSRHIYQTFALRLTGGGVSERAAVIDALRERGIQSGIATNSATLELPYRQDCARAENLPHAHALGQAGLALPLHLGLTVDDVDRVADALLGLLV